MSGRGLLESYPHRMAGRCRSGALRDLLGWAGDMEVDLLRRPGAAVQRRRTDDAALGWRSVRDELAESRPLMVWRS